MAAAAVALAALDLLAAGLGAGALRPRLGVLTVADALAGVAAATAAAVTAGSGAFGRRDGLRAGAAARANGEQARQAPAVRFQQLRHTVLPHDPHVRIVVSAAAPAAIWS